MSNYPFPLEGGTEYIYCGKPTYSIFSVSRILSDIMGFRDQVCMPFLALFLTLASCDLVPPHPSNSDLGGHSLSPRAPTLFSGTYERPDPAHLCTSKFHPNPTMSPPFHSVSLFLPAWVDLCDRGLESAIRDACIARGWVISTYGPEIWDQKRLFRKPRQVCLFEFSLSKPPTERIDYSQEAPAQCALDVLFCIDERRQRPRKCVSGTDSSLVCCSVTKITGNVTDLDK